MNTLSAVRGMNDILPEELRYWHTLEALIRAIMCQYGYQEIRMPILEQTALFRRSIGEVTDIVEKEMFMFEDRSGINLSLRPEGTAGCVRAGIEHGLFYHQMQRLWYLGPMFRHERPQKGRYRQFYQWGIEAFGMSGAEIDAELLLVTARLWQKLNLTAQVSLQLNSIGTTAARAAYRAALVAYLEPHFEHLDADSQRRLHTNPLRILDSKNPALSHLLAEAPRLADYWDDASQTHFAKLCALLDAAQIAYVINPRLVRGLDYYNQTVFEWVTTDLGAQGTVCAGGRYDGLVNQLGGGDVPAVGFSLGIERVVELLKKQDLQIPQNNGVYWITLGDAARAKGLQLAETLRNRLPQVTVLSDLGEGGLKNQLKRADKSGARLAIILGSEELATEQVVIKHLREPGLQQTVALAKLVDVILDMYP